MSRGAHTFPKVSSDKILKLNPDLVRVDSAILFCQMLTGTKPPEPVDLGYNTRREFECKFAPEVAQAPSLRNIRDKPYVLRYFSEKNVPGLANSLLIAILLEGLLYANRIVFLQKREGEHSTHHFFNINFAQMFTLKWFRHLNLDDLFEDLITDDDNRRILKGNTDDDPDFWAEAYTFVLKVLLLPLLQIQQAHEELFFYYSNVKRQQADWLNHALLNSKFRQFLLNTNIMMLATALQIDTLAALSFLPPHLAKPIGEAILDNAIPFTSEEKLIDFVLNGDFALTYKKMFVFNLMKDKLLEKQTLAQKFAVIKELENDRFAIVRDRSKDCPYSLRGTAIKTDEDEMIPVCASYRKFREFDKNHLIEWAIENNALAELVENEEIMDFMKTHLDGHWWGQSIFENFSKTNSEKKIDAAVAEKEKKDHPHLTAFKKELQEKFIKEMKQAIQHYVDDVKTSTKKYLNEHLGINVDEVTEFVANVSSKAVEVGTHLMTKTVEVGSDVTSSLVSAGTDIVSQTAGKTVEIGSMLASAIADSAVGQRAAQEVSEFKLQVKELQKGLKHLIWGKPAPAVEAADNQNVHYSVPRLTYDVDRNS